ncbi:MAG TPA: LL-diaminopimelate aminotransferase [Firmicutes bacterium]|nr:LL-diaminopimelate aminotransferase [Bacillota bacterium]
MQPSERIGKLPRYLFAEIDQKVQEAVAKGVDVIRLGIGDPDKPTPDFIINRMAAEIRKQENHSYPPDSGLMDFKEAVAAYYQSRFDVDLDPATEVLPLIGSKEGIAHISACYVNPGDVNLVPDPGYPVYSIGTMFAGGEVVKMPLREENGFLPDFKRIKPETAAKAKLLFLNYPNNPTGSTAGEEFFREAVAFARKYNILVCHDAAYTELYFDNYRPVSLLQVKGARDVGIEFGSLSKPFNMTGWRIGYAVGNREAVDTLGRYKSNIDSGLFKAIQLTGREALLNESNREFLRELRKMYQERRDVAVQGLRKLGWQIEPPKATFYIYAPVPAGFTSKDFVAYVLEKTGVVLTPGSGFGEYGEGYFRIALTVEKERLMEAMERFSKAGIRFEARRQ